MRLIGDINSRTHNDKLAIVCEQAALPVEMFPVGGHTCHVLEVEKTFKQFAAYILRFLTTISSCVFPFHALKQILCGGWALELVNLKGSLVGGKGNEVPPIRRKFPKETWWFLYIDHCEVGEHIGVKQTSSM